MKKEDIEKIGEIIMHNLKMMSDRTYRNTILGKQTYEDVTQDDWDNSSFTFEELVENVKKDLEKTLTHKP